MRMAVAQASCAKLDLRVSKCSIACHDVRTAPNCVSLRGQKVVGILLAKLLDGQPACFVRSEGEFFVVSVNGQERTISRDAWRLLPEQPAQQRDGVRDLGHDQAPHHGEVR